MLKNFAEARFISRRSLRRKKSRRGKEFLAAGLVAWLAPFYPQSWFFQGIVPKGQMLEGWDTHRVQNTIHMYDIIIYTLTWCDTKIECPRNYWLHCISSKSKTECANRKSNPGQMLGRHLCYHYTIGAVEGQDLNLLPHASTVNRTRGLKIFSLALSQLSYRSWSNYTH